MPYIEGRVVHDADAHIMEEPTWLLEHADPAVREQLRPNVELGLAPGEAEAIEKMKARHADPEFRARDAEEIMARKNFKATGSTIAADRPLALDLLGVASQLVFNTFNNGNLLRLERSGDLDLAYGAARAHNRGMVEFCSVDARLLPTCYVPLADFDRSAAMAGEAIAMGAAALLVPSGCPNDHSPSHLGPRPRVAAGGGGRHPDRAPRRRRRTAAAPEVLRQRRRLRARLPRRRRELPVGRLHGHPRSAGRRPSPR